MKNQKKRASYHHGDLADAILNVSEKLISQKGISDFSLREAARFVKVDPSACYRHFKDKNEILKALAQKGFTKMIKLMEHDLSLKNDSPISEKIQQLGISYFHFAQNNTSLFKVMFGPLGIDSRDSSLAGDYPAGTGPYDTLLKLTQQWSKENKTDKEAPVISLELWSAVHGITCLVLDGAVQTELKSKKISLLISQMIQNILRGHKS